MARTSAEDPATVSFDDTKVAEVGEGPEDEAPEKFVALRISKEAKMCVPFLNETDAYFVKGHSGAQHILVHRASQRTFALAFGECDLVGFGFTSRDTIVDCFVILKDAYETAGAKSKGIKRTLSVSWMKFSDGSGDSVEGDVVAFAAAVMPPATVPTVAETFEECNALRVVVSEDIGRVLPFEYVLLLSEGKQSAAVTKCTIQRMAKEIQDYKVEVHRLKRALHISKLSKDYCFHTSKKGDSGTLIWYTDYSQQPLYSFDSVHIIALSADRSKIQIKGDGVYKVSLSIWADKVSVHIDDNYIKSYDTGSYYGGGMYIEDEFTCRMCAGTELCFITTGDYRSKKKKNKVTVSKL